MSWRLDYTILDILVSIIAVFALIPGSLLFVAVLAWKVANRLFGFEYPHVAGVGQVLDDTAWHRMARAGHPVRYGLFVRLPAWLSSIWRRTKRSWRWFREALRPPTVQESMLADAFWALDSWCETNVQQLSLGKHGLVNDEDGPVGRFAARMAEIRALRAWWLITRPGQLAALNELDDEEERQVGLLSLSYDDEHNFARLANVWRDLT